MRQAALRREQQTVTEQRQHIGELLAQLERLLAGKAEVRRPMPATRARMWTWVSRAAAARDERRRVMEVR